MRAALGLVLSAFAFASPLAPTARAQPAPDADAPALTSCAVTIRRAPEDVRQAIEHWVTAEPRCRTSLELRIVPAQDGLYLIGIEPGGRVHERLVPDAQSAGVLVASWIADDAVLGAAPPRALAAAPGERPAVAAMTASGAPTAVAVAIAPVAAPPRWLTLAAGLEISDGDARSIRGDVDVVRRGIWSLGIAGALTHTHEAAIEYMNGRMLAVVGISRHRGRWHHRLQGGIGGSLVSASDGLRVEHQRRPSLAAELAAVIGVDLSSRWTAVGGLALTLLPQRATSFRINDASYGNLSTVLGIARRL